MTVTIICSCRFFCFLFVCLFYFILTIIILRHFSIILKKETAYETSCLLPCMMNSFQNGVYCNQKKKRIYHFGSKFFSSTTDPIIKGTQKKNETGLVTAHGILPIHNVSSSSSNVITIFAAPRKNVLRVFANSACA